ncbi:MAG: ABC transporter ATP-binding protein [Methanolobus sp.]|nr:ABC transporter ATP-binding protein [Methanolobus sp.]
MGIKVDIRKRYYRRKSDKKKGIDPAFMLDASFETENELVVLFGRSGSGKTTTLQCIAGLLEPNGGKIAVNGKVYFDCHKRVNLPVQERSLGYVFQNYALFPHMDVKKNIAYGLKGLSTEEKENRVSEMLHLLHIEGLESNYPSQLSGGQKQRVALARALAPKPDILLLDEPFSALDMVVRMKLREIITEIQRELGIPVFFITHNHVEAFTIADKVVIFHDGRIQQIGTPEEVFYHPQNRHVAELVGLSNIFEDALVHDVNEMHKTLRLKCGDLQVLADKPEKILSDTVSWGIRPENLRILPLQDKCCTEGENLFRAHIKSIMNKGASKVLTLEIAEHRRFLIAEIANHSFEEMEITTGDECLASIQRTKIVMF